MQDWLFYLNQYSIFFGWFLMAVIWKVNSNKNEKYDVMVGDPGNEIRIFFLSKIKEDL